VRTESAADDRDRALGVGVEVDETVALRSRAVDDLHLQTEIAQSALASMAELVIPERGVERRLAGELFKLHGGHRPAAPGLLEGLGRVDDLTRHRHVWDDREQDPLDMAHDCDPHGAGVSHPIPQEERNYGRSRESEDQNDPHHPNSSRAGFPDPRVRHPGRDDARAVPSEPRAPPRAPSPPASAPVREREALIPRPAR
jgi:hypothetical protein